MYPKTILSLRALCFKADETQHYPITLYCDKRVLLSNRKILMDTLKELELHYTPHSANRFCYWVEELPLNQLYASAEVIDEELFIGTISPDLYRYFDHLPNRPLVSRIAGWRYRRGEIVEVLLGNCLTLGIVIDTPMQSASSHYRARQERLKQAKGEEQSEWELCASPCDNRYRVLLYVTPEQLALRQIPAPRLLQTFTLKASKQRELLQKRSIEYGL